MCVCVCVCVGLRVDPSEFPKVIGLTLSLTRRVKGALQLLSKRLKEFASLIYMSEF